MGGLQDIQEAPERRGGGRQEEREQEAVDYTEQVLGG